MAAGATRTGGKTRRAQGLFGVSTPATLFLFVVSAVLSLSLAFHPQGETVDVMAAYGWGYGPYFWEGELWRLALSQLLHTRLWHFACNAYWLLIFAPVLEELLGTRRFFLQTLAAAFAIGLAGNLGGEAGGIGLSGLIYFHFAYLWVLSRSEPAAERVCDRITCALLVGGMMVIGPVLTVSGLVRVGNLVHAAGFAFGMLAGGLHLLRMRRPGPRWARPLVPALLALPLLAGSWYLHAPQHDPQWHAWTAFHSDDLQQQLYHYRRAVELAPDDMALRYNLGRSFFEAGDLGGAELEWLRCVGADPLDTRVCQALFSLYSRRGDAAGMERWGSRLQRISMRD